MRVFQSSVNAGVFNIPHAAYVIFLNSVLRRLNRASYNHNYVPTYQPEHKFIVPPIYTAITLAES